MNRVLKLVGMLLFFGATTSVLSQNWLTNGNNLTTGSEFLGTTSGNFPLVLRTTPAQPILFQTNGAPNACASPKTAS